MPMMIALGALGLSSAGGSSTAWRNISQRGQVPVALGSASSPKLALLTQAKHPIVTAVSQFKLQFVNRYLVGGGPVNGPAYTIQDCDVYQGGVSIRVTFGGSNSRAVTAGEIFESDVITANLAVGGCLVRIDSDVTTSGYAYGAIYATTQLDGADFDKSYIYDPLNRTAQVGTNNALTPPTGQSAAFPLTCCQIVGLVPATTRAAVSASTSIEYGLRDFQCADFSKGGGYMRRAAYLKGWAHCSVSLNGQKYNDLSTASGQAIMAAVQQYATDYWMGFPTNDVIAGTSAASVRTLIRAEATRARANGISKVYIGNAFPRVGGNATDRCTTLGSQTLTVTGFGTAGVADTVMTDMASDVGSTYYNAVIDVRSTLADPGDPHLWRVDDIYTSTLAAALVGTANTSASFTAAPTFGENIVFDPGGVNQAPASGPFALYIVSGVGPYTGTAFIGNGVSQLIGAAVKAPHAWDSVHPYNNANAAPAVAWAAAAV